MRSYLTLSKAEEAKEKPETQVIEQLLCDHRIQRETKSKEIFKVNFKKIGLKVTVLQNCHPEGRVKYRFWY